MIFKILDVYAHDNHLCLWVQHYRTDGSDWFKEHYLFQGREGLKQKRATNTKGRILMDNGRVAPIRTGSDPPQPYLPTGRSWGYRPGPHMDDSSILVTIRAIHQQRAANGLDGADNVLAHHPPQADNLEDELGCQVLVERFQSLKGHSE